MSEPAPMDRKWECAATTAHQRRQATARVPHRRRGRAADRPPPSHGNGRYGHRDATMILIAYRHGLRASELASLRWDMLDLAQGHLHVARLKNGRPSVHTVRGTELRALRRLQREQTPPSPYLFTTERHSPMTAAGFRKQLARDRAGGQAPLPHPPAHAAPCLRLHARQRPARHPRHPGMARPPQHPAHHPLHRAHHPPVQGFLATGGLSLSGALGWKGRRSTLIRNLCRQNSRFAAAPLSLIWSSAEDLAEIVRLEPATPACCC